MISTYASPPIELDIFMAKDKQTQIPWAQIGVWVVGGLVAIIGALLAVVYDNFDKKLMGIDTTLSGINISMREHGELLARLDERFKSLDRRVETLERPQWESKARASGLKSPQIIPTSLQSQVKFESRTVVKDKPIILHYTIMKYDPIDESIVVRVDGEIPNGKISNNIFVASAKPGRSVQLPTFFEDFPVTFLKIIDRPSPDRAILAIGEKIKASDKSS